ncbi:tetratricopeptide repeat protein [Polyangium sp. y55x31]|uniref:tetratricopeptide repeat protein n=1 Tax=Polyangium sp. y55x31 TaxID=3042688 RepID=UPI00248292D8|nr:tetratricopeptide repeat protein [Polyangium sp. y55x31]MDI1482976.1 tetratricopeptide repeat protein [Polyangium sp. y55x31]
MPMNPVPSEELWQRLAQGKHTALVGAAPPEPPASLGACVVRVRCDVPQTTLGPLADARAKLERLLGASQPLFAEARDRVVSGLRRRLLGEMPGQAEGAELVELANRFAVESGRPAVLVFEAVDAADAPTLEALRLLVMRSGWLKLPLLLCFRAEPTGTAASLLDALATAEGREAIVRPAAEAVEAAEATSPEPPPAAFTLRDLPADVLRVLRAGATVGSGFEVGLVSALVGKSPLDVLDVLQRAADLGVPLEDRGEGRFHLPEPVLAALTSSTLPSLSNAWHRMLASMLKTEEEIVPEAPIAEAPAEPVIAAASAADAAAAPAAAPAADAAAATAADGAPAPAPERPARTPGAPPYADLFDKAEAREPEPEAPTAADDEPAPTGAPTDTAAADTADGPAFAWIGSPAPAPATPAIRPEPVRAAPPDPPQPPPDPPRAPAPPPRGDDARAAGHLAAAGEIEASIERYRAAAEKAAARGAFTQALAHGSRALALLENLPPTRERRVLRVRLLVDLGRLQWQAAGPDPAFTLRRALAALDAARAALGDAGPAELRTEIAVLIASVCYDLGDMRSLERAEAELSRESRALLDAGDALGAARLLNDQAAVYVRMGDPVRAVHLLTESRNVFEQRAPNDPVAILELAETDHLLARIPLTVPPRPGREVDALNMGIDHALAAERTYKRLGAARELARVWETLGRLEHKKGRLDRAAERLSASLELGQKLGDIVGLARSAAAMSEVLAASGRFRDAFGLLGDSIALNLEKGSLIGIAESRRAFTELLRKAPRDPGVEEAARAVAKRLAEADAVLPRIELPGSR